MVLLIPCVIHAVDIQKVMEITISPEGLTDSSVVSRMVPGDLNGDGKIDWVFFNGTKFLKAYDHDGELLWQHLNPDGVENYDPWHSWIPTVWDMNNDGRAEVIAFRQTGASSASALYLTIYDGTTGTVNHETELTWFGSVPVYYGHRGICAIAYLQDPSTPDIVITGSDYSTEVYAYDNQCEPLWNQVFTPDYSQEGSYNYGGGHYVWPYDLDDDGLHEILAGRFLIDNDGTVRDTLDLPLITFDFATLPDHVDALVSADFVPDSPGREILTIGELGTFCFSVDPLTLKTDRLWEIPSASDSPLSNPQTMAGGDFDQTNPGPEVMIAERASEPDPAVVCLRGDGTVLRELGTSIGNPVIAVDIDGDRDEVDIMFFYGKVLNNTGEALTDHQWFTSSNPIYWEWQPYSIGMDVLGDGREEIIVWSNTQLVVGQNMDTPAGPVPSLRSLRSYKLRYANRYLNRSPMYFDFKEEIPAGIVLPQWHKKRSASGLSQLQRPFLWYDIRARRVIMQSDFISGKVPFGIYSRDSGDGVRLQILQ
jgi:hypothetical protein